MSERSLIVFGREISSTQVVVGAAGAMGLGLFYYLYSRRKSLRNIKDGWTTHRLVINKTYGTAVVNKFNYISNFTNCILSVDENWLDAEAVFALLIKGAKKSVEKAEEMINNLIEASPEMNMSILDIPAEKLKCVIGNLGETLIDVCQKSGTKIYLRCDPACNPGTPFTLEIRGPYEQNYFAHNLVNVILGNELSMPPAPNKFDDVPEVSPRELINATQNAKYTDVTVSSITSISSFWVQAHQLSHTLDKMERKLAEFYLNSEVSHTVTKPTVGMMIQVPYLEQEKCHRAKIVSIEGMVKALYYDYGDCEEVKLNNIKLLPEDFKEYPPFAVECCLHGIMPTNLNYSGDLEWTEEALDFFESLVSQVPSKVLMARKLGDNEIVVISNGRKIKKVIPALDLVDTNQSEDLNIAIELVSHGYAQWMTKKQES